MTAAGPARAGVFRIGVISDTHGLLPAAAEEALRGVDAIVHAGDVGEGFVLDVLGTIAPVTAVRGNNHYASERDLPSWALVRLGGVPVAVAHRSRDLLRQDPRTGEPVRLGIHGHTHRAAVVREGEVLLLNPGSASDPRGGAARSVAIVEIDANLALTATIVALE